MKNSKYPLCLALILTLGLPLSAQQVKVGLEPFPPLINENGTGLLVDLLKTLEKSSELRFDIKILPYSRAKNDLKFKTLDLVGLTPYQEEEKAFYTDAQELTWSIAATVDLYVLDKSLLTKEPKTALKKIGIPFGNADFMASILGLKREQFQESKLDSLPKLLEAGRVDAIIFDRASVMSTIKAQGIKGLSYKKLLVIPGGLAVTKDQKGTDLKNKLEALLKKVDTKKIFPEYLAYQALPDTGIVK